MLSISHDLRNCYSPIVYYDIASGKHWRSAGEGERVYLVALHTNDPSHRQRHAFTLNKLVIPKRRARYRCQGQVWGIVLLEL